VGWQPLADDRRYSRGHCWVSRIEGGAAEGATLWRVGLEPSLATALLRPRSIVLPTTGESVRRGQMHLWVVVEGGTFGVAAPLEGTVRASNARLAERPSLVSTAPLDDGWLYDVEATHAEPQIAALMDAASARHSYAVKAKRFEAQLSKALNARHMSIGPTLADGGAPLGDVSQMLGPTRYFELLCRIYR
jgi:glycine cleavage system H protein